MKGAQKTISFEKGDDIQLKFYLGKNGKPKIKAKVVKPGQERRRPLSDARSTTLLKVPLGLPICYTPYTFEQIKNYDLSNDKLHTITTFVRNIVNLYVANGGDPSLL